MRNGVQWRIMIAAAAAATLSCAKIGPEKQWANPLDPDGMNWFPPTIEAPRDTNVAINDTVKIRASGGDKNGSVARYLGSLDHGNSWILQSGPDGCIRCRWDSSQVGRHSIWLKAIDNDGLPSAPDSFTMIVHDYRPVLHSVKDTCVSQKAEVTVTVVAVDTNGTIVRYYWYTASGADSSTSPHHVFSKPEGGLLSIICGVRDDDGFLVKDTFSILFNRGPTLVGMVNPKDKETVQFLAFNFINETGSARLRFEGQDPDGTADTLTYTLSIGSNPDATGELWTGRVNEYVPQKLTTSSMYYWKLRAKDIFGDSVENSGSFSTPPSPPGPRGMTLIRSSGKKLQMGIPSGEDCEKPVHAVTFSYHYWIDTTEVTMAEYGSLMDPALPSSQLPAANINWYDAVLYCNARGKRDKIDTVYTYTSIKGVAGKNCTIEGLGQQSSALGYRLPTEAEWEYACRADVSTFFFWGDDRLKAGEYCWTRDNSNKTAHAVAQKKPNAFKLFDMSGNLWEWTNDWFDGLYYQTSPPSDPPGPESGVERVIRGGSWSHSDYYLGCGARSRIMPSFSGNAVGFRVVLRHP